MPDEAIAMARARAGVVGGLAQLARAPALQAGGQRFESVILHHCPPELLAKAGEERERESGEVSSKRKESDKRV